MSTKAKIVFHFFGWYFDATANNDKIWGWCDVEGKLYNFWGRRGTDVDSMKRLKFKRNSAAWHGNHDLRRTANAKESKGYRSIPVTMDAEGGFPEIEKVYPGFLAHIRKELMYGRLTGTVRGEEV